MNFRVYGTVICNGEVCPVTNLYDLDGDDTDDINLAVTAICKYREDKWITFDCEVTGIDPLS